LSSLLDIHGRPSVPGIEGIHIVPAHLFFGGETVGEFIEHQVRTHGGDAVHQDHEHPFHHLRPTSLPGTQRRELTNVPVLPWLEDRRWPADKSALGQSRYFDRVPVTSGLPL
jgi:hypothetical protein